MPNQYQQVAWNEQLADDCSHLIRLAVREDLDRGQDWTTVATVGADQVARASVVSREAGVFCGQHVVAMIVEIMSLQVEIEMSVSDGDTITAGQSLLKITGNARDMLTAERTILNFLGRLCGIATRAARYVAEVAGTKAVVYDTRKTTPGWRRLEKYAVRCGGGTNHRTGLFDAVLIKDNHLAFAGLSEQPEQAIRHVREFLDDPQTPSPSELPITIEVDTLEQLKRVLLLQPDIVLLDNMPPSRLTDACQLRDTLAPSVILEASGGITLDTLAGVAQSGVDRISVGGLTHSATNLDLGLDWC